MTRYSDFKALGPRRAAQVLLFLAVAFLSDLLLMEVIDSWLFRTFGAIALGTIAAIVVGMGVSGGSGEEHEGK